VSARRALVLLLFVLAGAPLVAQFHGSLGGQVLDSSEASIPGAAVTVINEETGARRVLQSQADGGWVVGGLDPGVYKITVRKEGFRTLVRFDVRVRAGETARVNFTLPVGSLEETITVRGEALEVNRASAAITLPVSGEEAEHLPLNGRGVLSLVEFAPGTVVTPATRGEPGQFTTNGQRPNTNYFLVDGVSANTGVAGGGSPAQPTGGTLPGLSAFGSLDALISLEAVREFRVQTSSSVAEFGRLPGAVVSLESRSGTNELHGSAYYRFRHEALGANDWFANWAGVPRAALRVHDPGATLGGRLRRNKTFFFLSHESIRLSQPFTWRAPVPSLAARAAAPAWVQPALRLFPAPTGGTLGGGLSEFLNHTSRPARLDAGTVRLDHAWRSRMALFARYREAPSSNQFGQFQTNRLGLTARSLTLGVNLRPTANMVFDLRANVTQSAAQSEWTALDPLDTAACPLAGVAAYLLRTSSACNTFVRFTIAGVGQLASGHEGERTQRQWQIFNRASWNRASHAVHLGVDWRRLGPRRNDPTGGLSVIADDLAGLNDERSLWIARASPQNVAATLDELSLWVQDTWRPAAKLAVTGGLRWEFSPAPVPAQSAYFLDPASGTLFSERRPLWQQSYRNFAPRLGLAWEVGHRMVLRAGGGIYYDSSLSIATDLLTSGPLSISQGGSAIYAPFSTLLSYGFLPHLDLPRVGQWNVALERALGERDTVSAAYVGSAGRRLVRREMGGPGSSSLVWVALATNHGASSYHGLQVHWRRRLGRGFHGLASYTWSHSLDDSSSDSVLYWVGGSAGRRADRGASDFDLRHALSGAFTYEMPGRLARAWRAWSVDAIMRARTGFPITVLADEHYNGIPFANAFRPNLVAGAKVWIEDRAAPAGGRLNPAAFRAVPAGVQGSLGRNAISGFGMSQVDVAVRREFHFRDRRAIETRLEAFNLFNQANFADPVRLLTSPLFGQSISMLNVMLGTGSPASGVAPVFQAGGPRSLQLVVRLRF
jgi:hypothetical protein